MENSEIREDNEILLKNYKFIEKDLLFHNACTPYKFTNFKVQDQIDKNDYWIQITDKSIRIPTDRKSNLIIFGLKESNATGAIERMHDDFDQFASLKQSIKAKSSCIIKGISRLNSKKESTGPAPLLIEFGGYNSQLIRNEVLKAAKNLRLTEQFKKVSISADMSVWQRNKLKELTVIRNNLNKTINKDGSIQKSDLTDLKWGKPTKQ